MECKLCLKRFSNGKALGGHMRTHYATLPLPPKTPQRQEKLTSTHPLMTDSSSSHFDAAESVVIDRESESESTREQIKKVFCSNPSSEESLTELKMVSGPVFEDFSTEEEVALCLVMLSKDVWGRNSGHKCGECDRVFKSSQGLGSHMTSHSKKIKKFDSVQENEFSSRKKRKKIVVKEEQVLHECTFCGRNFNSAQALGGHKRWHLLVSKSGESLVKSINISENIQYPSIDLNLPAAGTEDGDEI